MTWLPFGSATDTGGCMCCCGGQALDEWAHRNGVKLDFIRPGKPVENAYIESFNGRLRQECLDENWFVSLEDAKIKF